MPRGVSEQFLQVLRNEGKATRRVLVALALLALPTYFVAELVDPPLYGTVVIGTLIATLLGVGLGVVHANGRTRLYKESLLQHWNAWQRMSLHAVRVHEVARAVAQKGRPMPWKGPALALLVLVNALLVAGLWFETAWSGALGFVLAPANGLLLGHQLGLVVAVHAWVRRTRRALDELLAEGQVGYWGEK